MLTNTFERLCELALRMRLPQDAEVHLFGRNNLSGEGTFPGKLVEKIRKLCHLLGAELIVTESDFKERDTGDNGLDIVGWLKSGDEIGSKLTFFGQCACTHEWVTKQHSSGDDAWSSVARFISRPANMCYIPFDFRSPDRSWFWPRKIHRTHLIDRFRILFDLGLQSRSVSPELEDALNDIIPRERILECRAGLSAADL